MSPPVALVTGSLPFAGLPSSPSHDLLTRVEGSTIGGCRVVTKALPVSYARLPGIIDGLVARHRPALVVSLGLALATPVLKLERLAVNVASFKIADNEGAQPQADIVAPDAPPALRATWDAPALIAALLDAGIPAIGSWHAGTHLCNLTLFCFLDALARHGLSGPCGFLHLPYTPAQVARFLQDAAGRPETAPVTLRELPSMPLELQEAALRLVLGRMQRVTPSDPPREPPR